MTSPFPGKQFAKIHREAFPRISQRLALIGALFFAFYVFAEPPVRYYRRPIHGLEAVPYVFAEFGWRVGSFFGLSGTFGLVQSIASIAAVYLSIRLIGWCVSAKKF